MYQQFTLMISLRWFYVNHCLHKISSGYFMSLNHQKLSSYNTNTWTFPSCGLFTKCVYYTETLVRKRLVFSNKNTVCLRWALNERKNFNVPFSCNSTTSAHWGFRWSVLKPKMSYSLCSICTDNQLRLTERQCLEDCANSCSCDTENDKHKMLDSAIVRMQLLRQNGTVTPRQSDYCPMSHMTWKQKEKVMKSRLGCTVTYKNRTILKNVEIIMLTNTNSQVSAFPHP